MNKYENTIRLIGMKPRRSIIKYIETQVKKWIDREQSLLFLPKSTQYQVEVEKDPIDHCYHCKVEVRIGVRVWQSFESGRTLPEALTQGLRFLKCFANVRSLAESPMYY